MCKNFKAVWEKRLSAEQKDQEALYLYITQLVRSAKKLASIADDEKESFISDFYMNKILEKMFSGTLGYLSNENITPAYIVQMMNNYVIDHFRSKTSTQEALIDRHIDIYQDDFLIESGIHNHNNNDIGNISGIDVSPKMIKQCENFLMEPPHWKIGLMVYHFHHEKKYLVGIKSIRYRRVQLGLARTNKQSFQDYHKTTLIGQWLVQSYGQNILPLEITFLEIIFTSFAMTTLVYIETGDK